MDHSVCCVCKYLQQVNAKVVKVTRNLCIKYCNVSQSIILLLMNNMNQSESRVRNADVRIVSSTISKLMTNHKFCYN